MSIYTYIYVCIDYLNSYKEYIIKIIMKIWLYFSTNRCINFLDAKYVNILSTMY